MDDSHRGSGDWDAGARPPIVNTHVHLPPNFSAFDTAEQAVQLAAAEGVAAFGTSNYYDFGVYRPFAAAAAEAGVVPLFGVEIITLIDDLPDGGSLINDPTNLNRMYLCGKALSRLDPPIPSAARRMAAMRAASDDRIRQMTALVAARFAQAGLDGGVTDRADRGVGRASDAASPSSGCRCRSDTSRRPSRNCSSGTSCRTAGLPCWAGCSRRRPASTRPMPLRSRRRSART